MALDFIESTNNCGDGVLFFNDGWLRLRGLQEGHAASSSLPNDKENLTRPGRDEHCCCPEIV